MEEREKKSDPRKEILVRQIGAKIAYYRTLHYAICPKKNLQEKPVSVPAVSAKLNVVSTMTIFQCRC